MKESCWEVGKLLTKWKNMGFSSRRANYIFPSTLCFWMQEFCSFAILPVRSNTRLTFRFQAVTWNTRKQPLSKDLLVISLSAVRRKGMKLCMITGICLCSKIRQFFLRLANQRYSEQYAMQASNSIKLSSPPPPPRRPAIWGPVIIYRRRG